VLRKPPRFHLALFLPWEEACPPGEGGSELSVPPVNKSAENANQSDRAAVAQTVAAIATAAAALTKAGEEECATYRTEGRPNATSNAKAKRTPASTLSPRRRNPKAPSAAAKAAPTPMYAPYAKWKRRCRLSSKGIDMRLAARADSDGDSAVAGEERGAT
jgi:hypothetical protein